MITILTWQAVRVIGLVQFLLGYTIGLFYHPNPCRDSSERENFIDLMSMQFSGRMIFHAKSPDEIELPREIKDQLMMFGQIILVIVAISLFTSILKLFLKITT